MNLYNILKSDLTSRTASMKGEQLRAGQILQGKVLKLYPENKAAILLGGKRLIANLEVGLQVDSRYHFQVQSAANVIQLKVLGEELKGKSELDVSRLLQQLGLRDSKANTNLVNSLFRSKVPFDHQQLTQAVQLLKNEKDKPAATRIIIEMIARKLPVNLPIFRALSEANQTSVTQQLDTVIQQMKLAPNTQSNLQERLMTAVSALADKATPFKTVFTEAILDRNMANNPALFRTLQGLGLVNLNVDFAQWTSEWASFANKGKEVPGNMQSNFPFQLNEQVVLQALAKVNAQQSEYSAAINKFISQWDKQLNFHQLIQSGMTKEDFTAMQQSLKQDILPLLTDNQRAMLNQLINSPNHLAALHKSMQTVGQGDELGHLLQLMQKATSDEQFLALPPKQQFLQHQNLFMQSFGFDYENQLAQLDRANHQNATIKGLLLQFLSGSESNQTEANQKLLHLINGMQIKSVNEAQGMLQANIQIPAERLGLIKDIELEFEGRKTKNGEIDPDFCRILFHLNLQRLNETVIDMNIQQRKVSLTVFNNYEEIDLVGNLLKNKLKVSLEDLGYELIVLQYKKFEEKESPGTGFEQLPPEPDKKGVDFRV